LFRINSETPPQKKDDNQVQTTKTAPATITVRFKYLRQNLRDLWESYNLIAWYLPHIHRLVKADSLPTLTVRPLQAPSAFVLKKERTFGAISHLRDKVNPRRVITDGISLFEDFLGDVVECVYRDYPMKLATNQLAETQDGSPKLLDVVLRSSDKAEILDHLIEEKIRGLFYGKPKDFFQRDPAKLEFGDYFRVRFARVIEEYAEVTARRNLIVHSGGKVDRKYLREVKGSPLRLGQIVPLEEDYLFRVLGLLEGLAAACAGLVIGAIYGEKPRGKVAIAWAAFERTNSV
jgi:hypothetical protein